MPLRYAYEAMIVCQAVRNPFEIERIRLQRRVDRLRDQKSPPTPQAAEQFDLAKEGLRRLLAAGASNKSEAAALVSRIRRISTTGTRIEVETMKLWPDDDINARPASEFFLNEHIDLIVREAETFRNDYRSKDQRVVFNALVKPLPWAKEKITDPAVLYQDDDSGEIETQRYCGVILLLFNILCIMATTVIINRQNRMTR
jgi:hypothetical protein